VSAQTSVLAELHATGEGDVAVASSVLTPLVAVNLGLMFAIAVAMVLVTRHVDRTRLTETWGCGYAAPTPRMQYSARGFSELLTTRALPRWLRTATRWRSPEGTFPATAAFASDAVDPLTRGIYEPLLLRAGDYFARLRFLQQGNLHVYLLYILAAVIGGLTWIAVRDWPAW
jgi:hypothetical protein